MVVQFTGIRLQAVIVEVEARVVETQAWSPEPKGDQVPERRLPMRKIKKILQLHHEAGLSERQIADICLIGKGSVRRYLERAAAAKLGWPLPEDMDETQLEQLLFPPPVQPVSTEPGKPRPDFAAIHRELKSDRHVTLQLLWEEYKEQTPGGVNYSWFCEQYQQWAGHLDVVMRQEHRAGDKTFVDHAGDTMTVIDPDTGKPKTAYLFVAVLGASNYTYAEATWTRGLSDWIASHSRALAFFGGTTRLIVPDQWRAGVSKPCYWDPELNRTYQEWAEHNGVAVVPARPRRPRDKAKVEQGVLLAERWIIAALRKRRFFQLPELNQAIRELLDKLNRRPFRKLPGTRLEMFEQLDRPVLKPLPASPYVLAEWRKQQAGLDYHVEFDGHHYSVPFQLARRTVEIRATASTVEVLFRGNRVASHARSHQKPGSTTVDSHKPKAHQRLGWTPAEAIEWAETIGPLTRSFVQAVLADRPHPEAGFRAVKGLRPLAAQYGAARLEAACGRALHFQLLRLANIRSILASGLDQQPLAQPAPPALAIVHDNIRGPAYYAPAEVLEVIQ
jgi:transposase